MFSCLGTFEEQIGSFFFSPHPLPQNAIDLLVKKGKHNTKTLSLVIHEVGFKTNMQKCTLGQTS